MATIKESNIKLLGTMKDELHLQHAMKNAAMKRVVQRHAADIWKLPVCGACEKLAQWNKGWTAYCPECGKVTDKPITFGEFYEAGYHRDGTVHKGAPKYVDREKTQGTDTVYGGEIGSKDKDKKIIVARS